MSGILNNGLILRRRPRRSPDMAGRFGEAWRCPAVSDTAIALWLVRINHHPSVLFWAVGGISLDPARGFNRRQMISREATHEITIYALDPEHDPPDPDVWEYPHYLEPADFKTQCELPKRRGDLITAQIVGQIVEMIVEHGQSPDAVNRPFWNRAVGATVRDYREGNRRG